ncbi:MAG: tetratricopeptide repeat protein [Chitinivibrionales bacterium]|nr:tetratricopeptide repeat protein [Chitinivibrionales bacterium]
MNIQYSKKKEELRRDPLLEFLAQAKQYVQKYNRHFIASAIGIVVVVAGIQLYGYVNKSSMAKAKDSFGRAMILYSDNKETDAIEAFKGVVEKYGQSPQAAYSAYMIGQILVAKGKFDDAIPWLEKGFSIRKNTGFIQGNCLEALGVCYEAKGDLQKAQSYLEKSLNEPLSAYRHTEVRWKLALINKKLGDKNKATEYCNAIVADTTASMLKQKAENLLIQMQLM